MQNLEPNLARTDLPTAVTSINLTKARQETLQFFFFGDQKTLRIHSINSRNPVAGTRVGKNQ